MLVNEIEAAIDAAHGGHALDEIMKAISGAYSFGALSEETYAGLLDRITAKRAVGAAKKAGTTPRGITTIFPQRRPQRPHVRAAAIERRRRCAASGALPPTTATSFTPGEQAVLAVVVGEVRARGDCRLPIDAIAAMAGVGRTTAKNAIRIAADIGLVHVTLRPMKGAKNRTNIIAIVDRAVIAWIKRGPRRPRPGESGQKIDPHVYKDSKKGLPAGKIETQRSYLYSRTRRRR